ncbi:DUF4279 domain-containing protein [Stenotrophomonas bentonitica]|uniref:DUF4279 domain-containing protein n=1 Tax=Stenotrophomonas bentonitica TaxID=1450134 RepID=UPI00345E4469
MGAFNSSLVTLRFFGDDLVPEQVSALLGARPTVSYLKGEERVGSHTGTVLVAKTGSWRLSAVDRIPEDLDAQIFEVLEQLTQDLTVWESLARYRPDVYCGLFMGSGNDGTSLSAEALLAMGLRGISLGLEIYDFDEE